MHSQSSVNFLPIPRTSLYSLSYKKKNQLAQPSMQLSMRATIQEGLFSSTSDSQEQLHNSLNNILL